MKGLLKIRHNCRFKYYILSDSRIEDEILMLFRNWNNRGLCYYYTQIVFFVIVVFVILLNNLIIIKLSTYNY